VNLHLSNPPPAKPARSTQRANGKTERKLQTVQLGKIKEDQPLAAVITGQTKIHKKNNQFRDLQNFVTLQDNLFMSIKAIAASRKQNGHRICFFEVQDKGIDISLGEKNITVIYGGGNKGLMAAGKCSIRERREM